MPDRNHQLIYELFDAVYDLDDSERDEYLRHACQGNSELISAVRQLANRAGSALGFLQQSDARCDVSAVACNGYSADLRDEPVAAGGKPMASPGSRIGPYKIREKLGEGGMGEVYVAEQTDPVRRKVALKIIKPGMATHGIIARFEAERQALAVMSHANIAKVFDGGRTSDGRPYFVMELVRGIPITEFCDQHRLTTRRRLELFITVCQAVQHAHLKGIIHRDLKPSNVLVELHDVEAVPKVIDFGVAKAINQRLVEQSIYTQFSQLIGTPLYMSPEQAELSGLDIDTRSDVYSLGVMLYELLAGATPFEASTIGSVGVDELRRMIREDDPLRPSQKVSTLNLELASTVSTRRRTDPRQLSVSMQRELDWIVMKALEKDRTRRYESASDMAQDIQRYLNDEPVQACPPTLNYRLKKYARRHRGLLWTTGLLILTLTLGATVSTWQAIRATKSERLAEQTTRSLYQRAYADSIRNAMQHYLDGDFSAARALVQEFGSLSAEIAVERGFEWYLLDNLPRVSHREVYKANEPIRNFALNPSQQEVAIAEADGSIHILSTNTWRPVTVVDSGHEETFALSFLNNNRLLSTGRDGTVAVWRYSPGQLELETRVRVSEQPLWAAAAGSAPDVVFAAGGDEQLYRVDLQTGRSEAVSFSTDDRVESLITTGNGQLVVGTKNGIVEFLDQATLELISRHDNTQTMNGVLSLAVHSPRGLAAAGQLGGVVTLFDCIPKPRVSLVQLFPANVRSLDLNHDASWICAGDNSGRVHVMPIQLDSYASFLDSAIARRRRLRSWTVHSDRVSCVKFLDGTEAASSKPRILSAGSDGRVVVSEAYDHLSEFVNTPNESQDMAICPDQQVVLAGKNLSLTSLAEGTAPVEVSQAGRCGSVQYVPRVRSLYLLPDARVVQRTHLRADGQLAEREVVHEAAAGDQIRRFAVSHDAGLLALILRDESTQRHRLDVFRPSHAAPLLSVDCEAVNDLAFSPDDRRLAFVNNNDIRVIDLQTGDLSRLRGHRDSVRDLEFNPQGTRLYSVSNDRQLNCWDVQKADALWSVMAHENRAVAVACHPSLPTVATIGEDAIVRFWRITENGPDQFSHLAGEFPLDRGSPRELEFSVDGRTLVVRHALRGLTLLHSSFGQGRQSTTANPMESSAVLETNETNPFISPKFD